MGKKLGWEEWIGSCIKDIEDTWTDTRNYLLENTILLVVDEDDQNNWIIRADTPGVPKNKIQIAIESHAGGCSLQVKADTEEKSYCYRVKLPHLSMSSAWSSEASYADGVLTIKIPKPGPFDAVSIRVV